MLGKKGRDMVTGLEGIITAKINYLYGCQQLGITPEAKDGKVNDTCWFDEGRVEIIGEGIAPASVQADSPGGPSKGPQRY